MLSSKCKYAIRAVLFLSLDHDKTHGPKSGKDISEALKMPIAFTGKILQELVRKNLISSMKGPGGGFFLSEKNMDTTLIKIVEAIDDLSFFNSCGLGLSECSETDPCPIHDTFKASRDTLLALFNNKTIRDLKDDIELSNLQLVR